MILIYFLCLLLHLKEKSSQWCICFSIIYSYTLTAWQVSVEGGHREDMIAAWLVSWTWAVRGFSLLCPWNILPFAPATELFSRVQHWENNELRLSKLNVWLNPVKACVQTLKILAAVTESSSSCTTNTSIVCKSLCLLELPPANLEWSPLSSVSPVLCGWGQFWISSGELPRLDTNQSFILRYL